jgi:hypothetical protein
VLRCYTNNDAGNVLWEYAFEYLAIDTLNDIRFPIEEEGTIFVSADDPSLDLQAILVGFANRNENQKDARRLEWILDGDGQALPAVQTNRDLGIFNTTITMPTRTGSEAELSTRLNGEQVLAFSKIKVLPGVPSSISIESTGQASVIGVDEEVFTATIKDVNNNLVSDGTPVLISMEGNAKHRSEISYTINGRVSSTVSGGEFAVEDSQLIFTAGDASSQKSFDISKLNIEIVSLDGFSLVGATTVAQVKVTNKDGNPVPNIDLTAFSTYGFIANTSQSSNSEGLVTYRIQNPPQPGDAEFRVQAGFASAASLAYEVRLAQANQSIGDSPTLLNTRQAMVVGDRTSDGFLRYKRFDGVDIDIDYPAVGFIGLSGEPNSEVEVTLGDLSDPNISPVVSYALNRIDNKLDGQLVAPDATGVYPAELIERIPPLTTPPSPEIPALISIANDHPMGVGSSYQIAEDAYLDGGHVNGLSDVSEYGFRLDLKPDTALAGEIFSYGASYKVETNSQGNVTFTVSTDTGEHSVVSQAVLKPDEWNTVAGRFIEGSLEIFVNGESIVNNAASGATVYDSLSTLLIGQGFSGRLSGVKLFDLSAEPMLAIGDDGEIQSSTVTLGSDGKLTLPVRSLGRLNLQGKSISIARVAVSAGVSRHYATLLSSEQYLELGSYYVDNIRDDKPDYVDNFDLAFSSGSTTDVYATPAVLAALPWLVPNAHAFSFGDVGSWLWSGLNWVIPIEDIYFLGEQLFFLATSNPKFDAVELALAAICIFLPTVATEFCVA